MFPSLDDARIEYQHFDGWPKDYRPRYGPPTSLKENCSIKCIGPCRGDGSVNMEEVIAEMVASRTLEMTGCKTCFEQQPLPRGVSGYRSCQMRLYYRIELLYKKPL
jgi:hypothetical protein